MMSDYHRDPAVLWDKLLSEQSELVKSAFAILSSEEQQDVLNHLKVMAESDGWQRSQSEAAMTALNILEE